MNISFVQFYQHFSIQLKVPVDFMEVLKGLNADCRDQFTSK